MSTRRPDSRRRALPLVALAFVLVAPLLPADVVHLRNGRSLEGQTRPGKRPGTVEVRKGDGTVLNIPEEDIARIEKKPSPASELQRKLGEVPDGALDPLVELLVWARDKGLHRGVREIARKILALDPHHELARAELGYVVFQNRWVLRSELKKHRGLVRVGDEWLTREEKLRRERALLEREFQADLESLTSPNHVLRELALRKIRSLLEKGDPILRDVAARYLDHPHVEVRRAALIVIARFPAGAPGDSAEGRDPREIAADLHALVVRETDPAVLEVARLALARFFPRESFRLALGASISAPSSVERAKAAEVLYQTLRKAFVPELCRNLVSADGTRRHPEVHGVLVRTFRSLEADFGYDVERWLAFWRENESRFYDS